MYVDNYQMFPSQHLAESPFLSNNGWQPSVLFCSEAHALSLRAFYTFQYYNQLLYQLLLVLTITILTITISTSTRLHETPCRDFSQQGAIYWWTIQLLNYINLLITILYLRRTCMYTLSHNSQLRLLATRRHGGD